MPLHRMTDLDLRKKRVVIREDFNVPVAAGKITSDVRIRAALPTIQRALKQHAAVILLSHLGRPEEGKVDPALSLAPVAQRLQDLLGQPVRFVEHWIDGVEIQPGEVVLCENVRFQKGEKKNDPNLSRKIAALGDVFVMDAFATAHRAESSTCGVAEFSKIACAGPLLMTELDALGKALENPARPLVAIVGGAKVSTKLTVLESLITKVDALILGGGIANTFLAAQGFPVGQSLYEPDLVSSAQHLMTIASQRKVSLVLPEDVKVGKNFSATTPAEEKSAKAVSAEDRILDVGSKTIVRYQKILHDAKTILWNGPVGVFEFPAFSEGTRAIAHAVAESAAFSLAGGGETIAAIDQYGVADKISYISTGGGAFLEYVEGKKLPAVAVLEKVKS